MLGVNVRVLIRVLAQIKSRVVDDVALAGVHDVGAGSQGQAGGVLARVFELEDVLWGGGGGEAAEEAGLREEEGRGGDGEEGAFAGGVGGLELGEFLHQRVGPGGGGVGGGEEGQGAGAAGDDEDVVVFQGGEGFFVVNVGAEGGAGGCGEGVLAVGGEGAVECFAVCGAVSMMVE